jgi:uncharacterized protein YqeY
MQDKIDSDLKAAMLSGDKQKAEVLRGLKTALQYEAFNAGSQDRSVSDEVAQKVLAREAKKRQDTAEIYKNAGEAARAEAELSEKKIIDTYLPEQLGEEEVKKVVDEEVSNQGASSPSDMGKVIGAVRARLGASADGATIARLVKEALNSQ